MSEDEINYDDDCYNIIIIALDDFNQDESRYSGIKNDEVNLLRSIIPLKFEQLLLRYLLKDN